MYGLIYKHKRTAIITRYGYVSFNSRPMEIIMTVTRHKFKTLFHLVNMETAGLNPNF